MDTARTVRPVGARGALVEVRNATEALSLALWARDRDLGADEIVPAAATVLFDGIEDPAALRRSLADFEPGETPPPAGTVEIPTVYDGPDLDFVAEQWSMSPAEVVETHQGLEFTAAFCGFAPGFAYLAGLPEELAVPRLATPRTTVPAGAVALAGSWCGVYPTASPGGWRILGHTRTRLWNVDRDPPALLAPGTRVRFADVSAPGARA